MRQHQNSKKKQLKVKTLFVFRRDSGVHHRWYRGASLCSHQTATHWSLKVELSFNSTNSVQNGDFNQPTQGGSDSLWQLNNSATWHFPGDDR